MHWSGGTLVLSGGGLDSRELLRCLQRPIGLQHFGQHSQLEFCFSSFVAFLLHVLFSSCFFLSAAPKRMLFNAGKVVMQ